MRTRKELSAKIFWKIVRGLKGRDDFLKEPGIGARGGTGSGGGREHPAMWSLTLREWRGTLSTELILRQA